MPAPVSAKTMLLYWDNGSNRADWSNRSKRDNGPNRTDRSKRGNRPNRTDRSERSNRSNASDRSKRGNRPNGSDRPERSNRTFRIGAAGQLSGGIFHAIPDWDDRDYVGL